MTRRWPRQDSLQPLLDDSNWTCLKTLAPNFGSEATLEEIRAAAAAMLDFRQFLINVQRGAASQSADRSCSFGHLDMEALQLMSRYLDRRASTRADGTGYLRLVANLSREYLQLRCNSVRDALRNWTRRTHSDPPEGREYHNPSHSCPTLPG